MILNINNRTKNILSKHRSVIFPLILIVIFITLVALRISGTSTGVYHDYLYGKTVKDPSLIYGRPQSIRSDEWLVSTQVTIAQQQNGFHQKNDNFNGNEDMSVLLDVPYKEWSSIFKPQNLSFFILPLEYAFAFKWWFLLLILLLSSYYFFLKLLSNKIFISVFASIIISFSPFVFWWYQSF